MKKAEWKRKSIKYYLPNLPGIAVFCFMAVLVILGLSDVKNDNTEKDRFLLEESLRHAAVSCYAIEGRYPPSLAYLSQNYGVIIDDRQYAVHYSGIFASNIMPEITVVPLENE